MHGKCLENAWILAKSTTLKSENSTVWKTFPYGGFEFFFNDYCRSCCNESQMTTIHGRIQRFI